jgi:hypothetical protein
MSDYLVKVISPAVEAKMVGEKQATPAKPAVHELVLLQDAIAEDGKAVKVKGQKINLTTAQVDQRISQLEAELAKWKSILADIGA